ncbi:MAG: hypothetical protein FJZ79_04505 [Chlorobi bacterium]|nr:hypothetical protein [Chlorobiota bacterium]
MKIVFCGPPHSGKSCLRYGLREAIRKIQGAPYPYVITACPDGEGSWYQETYNLNPEHAELLKKSYKGKFTDDAVDKWSQWVDNCELPLTFVDIGGIPDEKNVRICSGATHAILLSGNRELFSDWYDFCKKASLKVIAELTSDHKGTEDVSLSLHKDGIYRGSIHYLERGDLSVRNRPTIIELAVLIVSMVESL